MDGDAALPVGGMPSKVVLNEDDGMKSPCAVNRHNAVTVSQQRLGNVWPSLIPHECMRYVLPCASLWVAIRTSHCERSATAPLKPKAGLNGPPASPISQTNSEI
jgi:hypothetical protein